MQPEKYFQVPKMNITSIPQNYWMTNKIFIPKLYPGGFVCIPWALFSYFDIYFFEFLRILRFIFIGTVSQKTSFRISQAITEKHLNIRWRMLERFFLLENLTFSPTNITQFSSSNAELKNAGNVDSGSWYFLWHTFPHLHRKLLIILLIFSFFVCQTYFFKNTRAKKTRIRYKKSDKKIRKLC